MQNSKKFAPIGTKNITYISDDNATVVEECIKFSQINEYIRSSIDKGVGWLTSNLIGGGPLITNNKRLYEHINRLVSNKRYDEEYNKEIVSACLICRKISGSLQKENIGSPIKKTKSPGHSPKTSTTSCHNLQEILIDQSTVSFEPFYLLEVSPGCFQQFVTIKHGDHFDYLPASYIYNVNPSLIRRLGSPDQSSLNTTS